MTRSWTPPEPLARKAQADKIIAILRDHLQSELTGKNCLEVGCGNGEITHHLANHTAQAMGLEINGRILRSNLNKDNRAVYVQGDGRQLPFEDGTLDIVVLAQVYEHMTRQERLSAEIFRVLKPGGVCFFSGPNRWQVIEPHYFLPFLAWLPRKLASVYLKMTRRGDSFEIYPRSYWRLSDLWRQFQITDYTWKLIKYPGLYSKTSNSIGLRILKYFPIRVIKFFQSLFTNYNWILEKGKN